jgi:hypothetical protein
MPRQDSEGNLRDHLLKILYTNLVPGQSMLEDETTHFEFACQVGKGECTREGSLSYYLPSGLSLSHKSDILISLPTNIYLSMELKFRSAVTDQFKTRSYDMMHLKRSLGTKVRGIMIYVHVPGHGISIDRAKAICYPFDHFVGLRAIDLPTAGFWEPVISVVRNILNNLGT